MRPTALIIGESLGVRTTLAAALGHCYTVKVVRTAAARVGLFATTLPDIIITDVVAEKAAAESVYLKLRAAFVDVPLFWIASPSQWAPFGQERCAVFRTPLQYSRLLTEATGFVEVAAAAPFQKPGYLSNRVMDYVAEHFSAASVQDIAQAIRLSPGRLSRVFRHEMGFGPKDFLTRVRLEAARCLLRETREKVAAIATMVGFYDAPHLIRLFRSFAGCTPREYRQIHSP
jgi:AraC-like DNA-binding protein